MTYVPRCDDKECEGYGMPLVYNPLEQGKTCISCVPEVCKVCRSQKCPSEAECKGCTEWGKRDHHAICAGMSPAVYKAWVVIYKGKFWALFGDEWEARNYARNRLLSKYTEIREGTYGGWE